MQKKIISPEELVQLKHSFSNKDLNFVLTSGDYSLLHVGHLRHLRQAKELGDKLVVIPISNGNASSSSSISNKLQAEGLAHLDFVDYVCAECNDISSLLEEFQPSACAMMPMEDNAAHIDNFEAHCKKTGANFILTELAPFDSSSGVNSFLSHFSDEANAYLELFKSRFSLAQIEETMEAMRSLKVAVIGDTILDEYCFCNPLGTSSKDPILALQHKSQDLFAGGILAVANHVANFAKEVGLFTTVGDQDDYMPFIKSKLSPAVDFNYVVQKGAPTVRKLRYVEGYSQNKILEIYHMNDVGLSSEEEAIFQKSFFDALSEYDMILVADFGHGAISQDMRDKLCAQDKFLAVNTQANSGNRGFHTITKYKRADFVSIAEHELRLEMRDTKGKVRGMIDHLVPKLSCDNFIVTRGKRGSLIRSHNSSFVEVPAFAKRIVDRIGAGDTFLSLASMAAKLQAPPELICFIGNLAGGLAVEIIGNEKAIDRDGMSQFAASLLR